MNILLSLVLFNALTPITLYNKSTQTILATTYYADCDGDSFGNPLISQQASSPPPTVGSGVCGGADPIAWVLNNTDCDDRDSSISPNAIEICDGIDNNCDAVIDTDAIDRIQWCADRDSDMFGNINDTLTTCFMPSGFVLDCNDCDDTNSSITTQCLLPIFIDGFE